MLLFIKTLFLQGKGGKSGPTPTTVSEIPVPFFLTML